jgi:hypothetical protein
MTVSGQQVNNKKKYSVVNMDLYKRVMEDNYLSDCDVDESQTA